MPFAVIAHPPDAPKQPGILASRGFGKMMQNMAFISFVLVGGVTKFSFGSALFKTLL